MNFENSGRAISDSGGFIPAGTKFDTIPVLRGGEQVPMSAEDLYVMRGLFCGEASSYIKHAGKLSLGDAIATAKDSANLLRRMSVYEGCVRPNMGDCPRLPVMNGYSLLSSSPHMYHGYDAKFYRRFTDIAGRVGAMSFPEVQKFDFEALWVLNQAQVYCRDQADRNTLQRLIPKECQAASDDMRELSTSAPNEDILVEGRIGLYEKLDIISDNAKFACEMSLAQLSTKCPGKSARSSNAIWTGIQSDRCKGLSNSFLSAWSKSSPESQARSIAYVLPGDDLDLPVGCIRYTHSAFGRRYQSELPFYDSDVLKEWSKEVYAEAVSNGTMHKVDVVLPKTVTEDDILPATFSDDAYQAVSAARADKEKAALVYAQGQVGRMSQSGDVGAKPVRARSVGDLNAAAADVVQSSSRPKPGGQSL